jgi:hypothetical protein
MSALGEARESLAYWESRLERLPFWAVRKRREARAMALRWRERVSEAERRQYGAGLVGAALLFLAERRLPVDARGARRTLARVGVALAAFATVMMIVGGVIAVEIVRAIL